MSSSRRGIGLMCLAAAPLALMLNAGSAQSQEWGQYLALEDLFSIDFPGEPAVRETTYETEYGITLPARVYTAEDDFGAYSITAVDWREAPVLHEARYEACRASSGDLRSDEDPGSCSGNRARNEIGGAMLHAAFGLIKRGDEVTYLGQMDSEEVEGIRVSLLNADGSRAIGATHWHEGRLYLIEAIAPQGAPTPNSFPVSMGFIDEQGRRLRYEERYSPLLPTPRRTR